MSLIFDTYNADDDFDIIHSNDYISNVLKSLNSIYEQTTSNIMTKQIQQNSKKNEKAKLRKLNVKDIVYLKSRDKFNHRLDGPFSIIKCHNEVDYSIQALGNPHAPISKVHINRLQYVTPRRPLLATAPVFVPNLSQPSTSNCPPPHSYFLRSRH